MRKRRLKLFTFLLTLVMMVSVLGTGIGPAKAAEMINTVELTGVPEPVVGQPASPYSSDVDGTNYTVTGTWQKWDYSINQYVDMNSSDLFEDKNIYRLNLRVIADAGYEFDTVHLTINGEEQYGWGYSKDELTANMSYAFGTTMIEKIIIDEANIPKAVIGENFTDTYIDVPTPADSGYVVKGKWYDSQNVSSGTFTDGEVYYFFMEIYPKTGCAFSEHREKYIGDELIDYGSVDPAMEQINYRKSFATIVDEVTLDNVPKAVPGETITNLGSEFNLTVPDGAKYTATGIWYLNSGDFPAEATFKEGMSYKLLIEIIPEHGFEFADATMVYINGVAHKDTSANKDILHIEVPYSFAKVVDKIEVTGITEPKIGEAPSTSGLKVPDGANYTIDYAHWVDIDDYDKVVTVFEAGHAYDLVVQLTPKQGYEFGLETEIYIGDEFFGRPDAADWVLVIYNKSLKNVLPEVKIDGVQEMKVGEKSSTKVTVPQDAKYEAIAEWRVWDDNIKDWKAFDGTFEEGKTYYLNVDIFADQGYEFSEDATKYYVNGILSDEVYGLGGRATYSKEYSTGLKAIDKVEITIKEPVVGQHTSITPVITLPDGANYTLESDDLLYNTWLQSFEGDDARYELHNAYIEAGNTYGAKFKIYANEGYMFSEDVVVIVNGISLTKDYMSTYHKEVVGTYTFGMPCEHIYTDDTDETCDACGYKRHVEKKEEANVDASPATGDDFNSVFVFMIMSMCGIALLYINPKRKENKI